MAAEKDPAPKPEPTGPVELEPLVTRAEPPRHVERSHVSATHPPGEHGSPIPARPLHECPSCEYNLTGLISRRCPECGEPFTLSEARQQGSLRSPRTRQDLRAVRADRVSLQLGIALQLASVIVPMIVLSGGRSGGQIMFMWIGLTILTLACLVKGYFAIPWAPTMLTAGLVSASVATMLLIMLT